MANNIPLAPEAGAVWLLKSVRGIVGTIELVGIDQPSFKCRFVPSPAWADFSDLFEKQARVVDQGIAEEAGAALKAVQELELILVPVESAGQTIRPSIIQIRGDRASFRF
ncbi:hypothetical protein [Streptomyces hundungensis]|uniref:hypothetical protein n=1 Tax=Streptomyces hundungensis TaxID=1077946 RepID=UPI0013C4FF08|nr:hypothetical protein [Streptomyces hundungensis]